MRSTLLRTFTLSSALLNASAHQLQHQHALQPVLSSDTRASAYAPTVSARPMASLFSSMFGGPKGESEKTKSQFSVQKSDNEWKQSLSAEEYRILRKEGTEMPGSSPFTGSFGTSSDKSGTTGTFTCAGCSTPLYSTDTKFASGCGWPAFYAGLPGKVGEGAHNDGSARDEIWCTSCGGHLGHVFRGEGNMGKYGIPSDTRHCVNGAAMKFEAGKKSNM